MTTLLDGKLLINDKTVDHKAIKYEEKFASFHHDSSDDGEESDSSQNDSHEDSQLLPLVSKQSNKLLCADDNHFEKESIEKGNGNLHIVNKQDERQTNPSSVRLPPPFARSIQSALQIAGGIVLATAACNVAQSVNDLIIWDEPEELDSSIIQTSVTESVSKKDD